MKLINRKVLRAGHDETEVSVSPAALVGRNVHSVCVENYTYDI
jgi:hypothetical protein